MINRINLLASLNNSFELFGRTIYWYGVILTFGMVCALGLLIILAKREKVEPEFCLTAFLFAIIFAIFGARLFYVVPRADFYFTSWSGFMDAFNISEGGLTIIGGIPMGALGIYIACRIYKKSFFRICDLVVPCLLLGQVIGRWGNYVNGELYGFEITNEAFQKFPIAVKIVEGGTEVWHAANFFYEMMLNLVMLIIMLALTYTIKKKLKVGFLSILYIIWYGIVRGLLEFVKVGQLMWGSVRAVQFICFLCAAVGVVFLVLLQLDIIRFETPKMYDRHFKIVHEPPEFGAVIEQSIDIDQPKNFVYYISKFIPPLEAKRLEKLKAQLPVTGEISENIEEIEQANDNNITVNDIVQNGSAQNGNELLDDKIDSDVE
ncbi:MAG: prolipoprotein diacylglyceryl transferase [Clostridia bacterium]|nr:prolipoprotein diacylglyceryl transferase [Clostridia bacterium]